MVARFGRAAFDASILSDYPTLHRVLPKLSEAEVIAALELEGSSRRRPSLLRRLIRRATRLAEIRIRAQLEEKYMPHDQSSIMTATPKKRKKTKKTVKKKKGHAKKK